MSCFSHKTGAGPEGCWPVGITMKRFSPVEYLPPQSPDTYLPLPSLSSAFVSRYPWQEPLSSSCATCTQGQVEGRWDRETHQTLQLRKGLGIYSMLGTHLGGSQIDTPVQEVRLALNLNSQCWQIGTIARPIRAWGHARYQYHILLRQTQP